MNFVLIFLITIFSLSLFFYGRSKTKSIAIEKNNQLKQLNTLYKSGVITKEEFEKAKKKILN